MTSNSDRQAAYRERMRKAGYKQVLLWIQPNRDLLLKHFAKMLRNAEKLEDVQFNGEDIF